MPNHPDNTCPICRGKGKSLEVDGVPRTNWVYGPWTDEMLGDGAQAAYLLCDGCNGSGLRSDYTARVLAGDFPIRTTTIYDPSQLAQAAKDDPDFWLLKPPKGMP